MGALGSVVGTLWELSGPLWELCGSSWVLCGSFVGPLWELTQRAQIPEAFSEHLFSRVLFRNRFLNLQFREFMQNVFVAQRYV